MHSRQRGGDEDLTARARIRDAAIRRFASDGMDVPVRAIAAEAGISPGLILHHFGSRAGLRAACDAHVLRRIRANKETVLGREGGVGGFLVQLAAVEGNAPFVGYVLRCLQAGDELAEEFVDHVVADAVEYLEAGVTAGTIKPSRDPAARARLLAEQTLGALLLQLPARQDHLDPDELPTWLRGYFERILPPLLELYTDGLLTDSSLLDAYLDTIGDAGTPSADPTSS